MEVVATAARFCVAMERAREMEKVEFVAEMTATLPRLYLQFSEIDSSSESDDFSFSTGYVDEDYYEAIRRGVEMLLGPDDTYLETFEEDMKYSDTPIGCSISENLADIFQDLFNFVTVVKESEGESLATAYDECRENFNAYWSSKLCNVMRPLNQLRLRGDDGEEGA